MVDERNRGADEGIQGGGGGRGKGLPYLPLWVNDFLGSGRVREAPAEIQGMYLLLLVHEWSLCGAGLPADRRALFRLLGADSPVAQACVESCITLFYDESSGRLSNSRLAEAYEVASRSRSTRSKAGTAAAAVRWERELPENRPDRPEMPIAMRSQCQTDAIRNAIAMPNASQSQCDPHRNRNAILMRRGDDVYDLRKEQTLKDQQDIRKEHPDPDDDDLDHHHILNADGNGEFSAPEKQPVSEPDILGEISPNTETESETESESASPGKPTVDVSAELERWNAIAREHGLATARTVSDPRRRRLAARLRDWPDLWDRIAAELARVDEWARGASWLTIDWVLSPANLAKLLDGNYRARARAGSATAHRSKLNDPQKWTRNRG